jgi:CxxC motif-containing protein
VKKEFVCIICPKSCELTVVSTANSLQVTGNNCARGITFAQQEITDPQRVLTTTVKLSTGELLPVRSCGYVKKSEMLEIIKQLKNVVIVPPIIIGETIAHSVNGNMANIIASSVNPQIAIRLIFA